MLVVGGFSSFLVLTLNIGEDETRGRCLDGLVQLPPSYCGKGKQWIRGLPGNSSERLE